MEIRRIAVYVDLSPASAEAVATGRRLATSFGAELYLLRVVGDPLAAGWTAELNAAALPQVQDAIQAETEDWLSDVLEDPDGLEATLDIETGRAEDEFLKYGQRRVADLLVIGAESDAGENPDQDRAVQTVVARARCAVLVTRRPRWLAEPEAVREEAARDEADPAPDDEMSYDGPTPEDEGGYR